MYSINGHINFHMITIILRNTTVGSSLPDSNQYLKLELA